MAASGNTDQATGIPLPGLIGPVKRVMIEFETVSGAERRSLGAERHFYVADSAGNYGLSVKQTLGGTGQAPTEPWQIDISGVITRQGLSPNLFTTMGGLPERLMARKAPADNSPVRPAMPSSGRVPDGLLDRQSLLYQFMLRPPELAGGALWLTDGVVHRLYNYRLAGIESFAIPAIGVVRTIRLLVSAEASPELIELWLVPDQHYLPVKVRELDRQGVVTERMAISLDFDE